MANCTGNSDTHTAEAPLSHSLDMLHWNLNCLLVWTWLPENRNWRVRHSLVGSDFFGCSLFSGGGYRYIRIYTYIHTHIYKSYRMCVLYTYILYVYIYIHTHIWHAPSIDSRIYSFSIKTKRKCLEQNTGMKSYNSKVCVLQIYLEETKLEDHAYSP